MYLLVCLTEFYCLDTLNGLGVYPDEYFTDFEIFKNRLVSMKDATLLVILAGTCRFNKRHITEYFKLLERTLDESPNIQELYVVSDTPLPTLSRYFKFTGSLRRVDQFKGWKKVKENVNLWGTLASEPHQSNAYLSVKDTGDTSSFIAAWENRKKSDDAYVELIKVADVKAMLGAR